MKLSHSILMEKIKELGLIQDNGKPISFVKFKQLADIHRYTGDDEKLFIIYIGKPKENLLAFYPPTTNRNDMLKMSYEYLVDTITTDIKQDYLDDNIMWGNRGIPIGYGNIIARF